MDPDNNSSWDFVAEVNASGAVGLGIHQELATGLTVNKTYFYRAYAENLGRGLAPTIESFRN